MGHRGPLPGGLPFHLPLGHGAQDTDDETAPIRGGVHTIGGGDNDDAVGIAPLQDGLEVHETADEAVHVTRHDDVHVSSIHRRHHRLEPGAGLALGGGGVVVHVLRDDGPTTGLDEAEHVLPLALNAVFVAIPVLGLAEIRRYPLRHAA